MIALLLALFAAEPLTLRGAPGLWLTLPEAREANECLDRAPLVAEKLRLLVESDALATREIVTIRAALSDSREQSAILQAQLEREAERAAAWWRQPAPWYLAGALTAVIGVLVLR